MHTSGTQKDALDPFRPERPEDIERLKSVQADVHESFKALVRARRGDRLTGSEDELFNGAFWVSGKAKELGLIDDVGEIRSVLRKRYGEDVRLIPVASERPFWRPGSSSGVAAGRAGVWQPLGDAWPEGVLNALDARALWGRFGL